MLSAEHKNMNFIRAKRRQIHQYVKLKDNTPLLFDFFDLSGFDSFSFGFFFDLENSLLRNEPGLSTKRR